MYNNYGPGALLESDTRLYDLAADPGQEKPIARLRASSAARRPDGAADAANEAPPEAFQRLGLVVARAAFERRRPMTGAMLRAKVGDLRQFASVRRIVLDDGVGARRARARDFELAADSISGCCPTARSTSARLVRRACRSPGRAWPGFAARRCTIAEDDGGRGFNRSNSRAFSSPAGSITSASRSMAHPLHGRLPFTPARVIAYGEDWDRDEPVLFCEGEVMQFRAGGETLRLRRRIEAPIGGCELRIRDVVENLAAEPSPQASLYHFNLGHPAIAPGSTVEFGEKELFRVKALPDPSDHSYSRSFPAGSEEFAVCNVSTPVETWSGH